jgi:hypothetical protein
MKRSGAGWMKEEVGGRWEVSGKRFLLEFFKSLFYIPDF